jgi:hypothetical protein
MAKRSARIALSADRVADYLGEQCIRSINSLSGADKRVSRFAESALDILAPLSRVDMRTLTLPEGKTRTEEWNPGTGNDFRRARLALDLLERICLQQAERFKWRGMFDDLPETKARLWDAVWRGFMFHCDLDEAETIASRILFAGLSTSSKAEQDRFEKVARPILENGSFGLPGEIEHKKRIRRAKLLLLGKQDGEDVALRLVAHACVNEIGSLVGLRQLEDALEETAVQQ